MNARVQTYCPALCLLSVLQPSTAARYASKALAAHVGMLQSEALVLQYQRRFVEAELQKLKATAWPPQQTQLQEQAHQEDQQRHLLVNQQQQQPDNGCMSQPPPQQQQQQQHSQVRQGIGCRLPAARVLLT